MRDFFGCYLLESKHPKGKGHTYIGFTVNPRRRIRQHNGEITSGAAKTKSRRPWEMALVVYGFPTQVQALQFEWAWQHPEKSLDVRDIAAKLGRKKRYGVAGKALPEVVEDATDPPEEEEDGGSEDGSGEGGGSSDEGSMWPDGSLLQRGQPSSQAASLLTGVAAGAAAAAPALGRQQFDVASSSGEDGGTAQMGAGASQAAAAAAATAATEPAPGGKGKGKAKGGARAAARAATACKLCSRAANRTWVPCSCCGVRTHVECLARHFLQNSGGNGSGSLAGGPASGLLPSRGACPGCGAQLTWMEVLQSVDNVGWEGKSGRRRAGGKAATAASSEAAGAAAAQQGSPSESATGKARKPRGRKPAAATAAAAVAAAAVEQPLAGSIAPTAEAAVPKPKRGRPRKLQPLLGPDPSSSSGQQQQQQQQAGSYADLEVLEALPWDDFGLSSPAGAAAASAAASPGSSSRRPGRRQAAQQQQQQQQQDVVELLDSDDDGLLLPLAERLQQLHARQPPAAERAAEARGGAGFSGPPPPPQQQEEQEQKSSPRSPLLPQRQQLAAGSADAGAAAPAAAGGDVMDLVSPSPLPLLERLAKQQLRGVQSPRATPSPAPQRKLQKRFQTASADAIDGSDEAASAAAAWQQADDGSDVIVISDSE
ncbi:hypothetical protein COHA_001125 [Chlorella ohadii]|uniref:Structure-specific endonuclease subunit SLX1 homolog n=1 Tax=Chlorella ohadii TaxID=2649997 RepID=A0AAD5DVP9_9CHLO|nr:hypothetical protein COHA_001125 [Chlorella ohadii]